MSLSPEEKIHQLEKLLEGDEQDFTGYFMLGKLCVDAELYPRAVQALDKCLAIKPDYSAAWRMLGDAHRKAGDEARAREVYEEGIRVAEARGDLQTVREMQAFLRKL